MAHPTPEERKQLQLEMLQSTLNRAYKYVPFHQNQFRKAGMDPSKVESLDDLSSLPFMERIHLGRHYPYGLFAVPLRDIVRIHTAPGTTLNPTVTGYTKTDIAIWKKIVANSLKASGVTSTDIMEIFLEPGLANWGRDYKDGAEDERVEASVIPDTFLSMEKQIMVLTDYKVSVLITTPGQALDLSRHLFEHNHNATELNLKTLILVGEPVTAEIRTLLEEKLHVATWVHYGLSELPGPAIAFECAEHNGLHVNEDHFIAEIIDPVTKKVLPPGKEGELVLTTLTTRAYPLIRFRTGDRAVMMTEACPCGLTLNRIKWLPGRTDDMISIHGVKIHERLISYHLEDYLGFTPVFKYFVHKDIDDNSDGGSKGRQYLEIWIAVSDDLFSDEIKELEKLMRKAGDKLRENIGVPVVIRLKEAKSLDDHPDEC